MKKTMFVMTVLVAMVVLMGCQPVVSPVTPDPEPVPVKMPAGTLGAAYEKIIGTGTFTADTAMYRWDNNADGIADTGLFINDGVEKAVVLDNAEWVITVGGAKYLNAARMSESWNAGGVSTLTFVVSSSSIIAHVVEGLNTFDIGYDGGMSGTSVDPSAKGWKELTYSSTAISAPTEYWNGWTDQVWTRQ